MSTNRNSSVCMNLKILKRHLVGRTLRHNTLSNNGTMTDSNSVERASRVKLEV